MIKKRNFTNTWQTVVLIFAILSVGFTLSNKLDDAIFTETEVENIAITAAQVVVNEYDVSLKKEAAEAVLTTLNKNNIFTPDEIINFLAQKPAGRTDLTNGVNNQEVYAYLVNIFGQLARNAKVALN